MKIVIEGPPIPKNSVRCRCIPKRTQSGKTKYVGMAYNDQAKTVRPQIASQMLKAWNDIFENGTREMQLEASRIAQAQSLVVTYRFLLPANDSDTLPRCNAKYWGFIHASVKPDFDNLIKFYSDCANSVLWSDDKIIVNGGWSKEFSENPRTEIQIMSKKELHVDKSVEDVFKTFSPSMLKSFINDCEEIVSYVAPKTQKYFDEMQTTDQSLFLSKTAMLLSDFCYKYGDIIRKIQKIKSIKDCYINTDNSLRKLQNGELNIVP